MVAAQADAAAEEADSVGEGAVSPVEVRVCHVASASLGTLVQLAATPSFTAYTNAQTCDALALDGKVYHHKSATPPGAAWRAFSEVRGLHTKH